MIRVVTYDFWNTLLATTKELHFRRKAEWQALLAEAGHDITDEAISEAFAGSWLSFHEDWTANRQHLTADSVDRVLELLDVEPEPLLRERLIDGYSDLARPEELVVAPNLGETLTALKAAGVRLGIICDVAMSPGTTLRLELGQVGLLEHFDHFSFSDEVGAYKPDQAIFTHALEGLGASPGEAAHVGDLRRTDVAGANRSGWTSVRYTGLHDDPDTPTSPDDDPDHLIADHSELLGVLGL